MIAMAFIAFIIAVTILIMVTDNLIRIRDFRYELFRLRDEARFAFIREIGQCDEESAKSAIRSQFLEIQNLINWILKFPITNQLVLLALMADRHKLPKSTSGEERFRQLPMSFQRIVILAAMIMVRHMAIANWPGFLYFLFRASISIRIEQFALKELDQKVTKPRTAKLIPDHGRLAKSDSYVPWAESLLRLRYV